MSPVSLPCADTSFASSGCSEPHPTCPWTPVGMGHPQFLWATGSSSAAELRAVLINWTGWKLACGRTLLL